MSFQNTAVTNKVTAVDLSTFCAKPWKLRLEHHFLVARIVCRTGGSGQFRVVFLNSEAPLLLRDVALMLHAGLPGTPIVNKIIR